MAGLPILGTSAVSAPVAPPDLPSVRALAALWHKVQQLPMWLPRNLWTRMQLQRRMDLRFVSQDTLQQVAPVGKRNDCSGCTDICCIGQSSTVLLRLVDIATLIDIGRADLMTQQKPPFTPAQLAQKPALARHTHTQAWQRFPVLRQNDFGACVALSDAGKCTLYPHWPLSCARFPYALDVESSEIFYSSRCQSYWIDPQHTEPVQKMAVHAVAGYNERIKDALLLAYAHKELTAMGLTQHLAF